MNTIGFYGVNRSQKDDIIYGGDIYNRLVVKCLEESYSVDTIPTVQNIRKSVLNGLSNMITLALMEGKRDLWVRDFYSMLSLRIDNTKGKNIALIHHIDSSVLSYPRLNKLLEAVFYRNLKYIDAMVTGAQCWKEHFERHGVEHVEVIYSPFDFWQYIRTEEEIEKFKDKYELNSKPIIYLGNCQKAKGVVEAYRALKDMDAHLVTSGKKDVDLPAKHLELDFHEYITLLHASAVVVTMSLFKEGWCRTAHEAMLCRTPVVGSGLGGMGELLDHGGQIICKEFNKLVEQVEHALENEIIGKKGYEFATQDLFSIPHFQKRWTDLVFHIMDSH